MTPAAAVGSGAVVVLGVMLALWFVHRPRRNAGWVDFGWALSLGFLGVWVAAVGSGDPLRRILLGAMAGLWGLRLSSHLWRRLRRDDHEDGRYAEIRAKWGGNIEIKFLWFFLAQGVLDLVLAIPFVLAAYDPGAAPRINELAAVALFIIAWAGEATADRQLAAFRRDPAHRGRTCRAGLWRYSRHPNFFCEWLTWVAWALYATAAPLGWLAWLCPLLMLWFLLFVTGIPPTERQSLRSRGDDYRDYQRTTSAFVPWFPKAG